MYKQEFSWLTVAGWLDAGLIRLDHVSLHRGYVSRKIDGLASDYNGRFGKGFVYDRPNNESTRDFLRYYFIDVPVEERRHADI